ncbi:MAG TPA: metallophosphoesterase [Tepidisphaeraceae bacterium]|nr:metallophosphoesterase [Tepidisphaeraceae bacterium]
MKLLLFSDLHASADAARRIVEQSRGADVVVGAGDFGNIRRMLQGCIDILSVIDRPAVLVAGNNESTEELVAACKAWPAARVLNGSTVTVDGVTFFGLGGGVPITPFGAWSYDFSDEQAAGLLARCPQGCVLVSHSPPKGAVDLASNGQSLGSTAVRDCVLAKKPALVVCGHIHASAGQRAMVGASPVVNAGPGGVVWEL